MCMCIYHEVTGTPQMEQAQGPWYLRIPPGKTPSRTPPASTTTPKGARQETCQNIQPCALAPPSITKPWISLCNAVQFFLSLMHIWIFSNGFLHVISEDLKDFFFKFPPNWQRAAFAKVFKAGVMLNTGANIKQIAFSLSACFTSNHEVSNKLTQHRNTVICFIRRVLKLAHDGGWGVFT